MADSTIAVLPLRLVTITHCFPAHGGGLERVAARLVAEFARCGAEIQWFSSNTEIPPADVGHRVTHISVRTWNIVEQLTQLPYPLWSPLALPTLWHAVGTADAVHIHEHLYACSITALVMARLRGRPVIITQHMGALGLRNPVLTALYTCAARMIGGVMFALATRSVFISANVQQFFRQDANPRSRLIFNGTDTQRFTAESVPGEARRSLIIPAERKVVLFVGRFVRKKGLDILQRLAQDRPDVFWMIIGSGPENPQAWGYSNVRVYGRVNHDELPDYYRAADLLLLPSSGEGFPLVVQEALCCGTGVLSTEEVGSACPPASSMIRTCRTPRDAVDSDEWTEALDAALSDRAYLNAREERSATARSMWSWNRCVESYVNLMREVT